MNSLGPGPPLPPPNRRRSSPIAAEPFYSRLASSDDSSDPRNPSANHPYNYDYEANSNGQACLGGTGGGELSNSNPISTAFSAATRLRGAKQKLLWIGAILSLIYLFHSINSPDNDGHAWHPHVSSPSSSPEPPLDFYEPPPAQPPAPGPPPPARDDDDDDDDDDGSARTEIDVSKYVQPRRKIRPCSSNPWSDLSSSSSGGERANEILGWLGPDRFGSRTFGWKGMKDPEVRSGYNQAPPSRYLSKAFEYASRVADKEFNQDKIKLGKGTGWDRGTGRVKTVERKWLKWKGRQGWDSPLGDTYKVGQLGTGEMGEKEMERVQVTDREVRNEEGTEEFETREKERDERRDWVKRAFLHAWEGYKEHAWGHDELAPVSNLWSDNYNGWGATLVDNLDTLLIMNLSHEYNLARRHVSEIDFTYLVPSSARFFSTRLPPLASLDVIPDPLIDYEDLGEPEPEAETNRWISSRLQAATSPFSPTTIPLFETTIRYLGGLISAYDLSGGDPLMLSRARELGDWLLPSLNTDWGLAVPRYRIGTNPDGGPSGRAVLAEVGSLGMELIRLTMITGDETYYIAAQRAMDTLETRFSDAGPVKSTGGKVRGRLGTLLPSHVNPLQPQMVQGEYTFGGLADSYYEYLIKQAQLTSFTNPQFERMYERAIESAYEYLIRPVESIPGREHDLITIGTVNWGSYRHELQHLTCFAGGMLGLGAKLLNRPRDLETAKNFTEACVWVYESSETGIGGEQTTFYDKDDATRFVAVQQADGSTVQQPRGDPMGVRTANRKQIGRPETIESVFYMWRMTGDRYWQDRGWQMFTSWVEHSITESGFATVGDVNVVPARKDDSMESFVTAETLKYYYLLFSPRDFISLDDFVFNTEAHPFLIPKPRSQRPEPLWTGPEPELEARSFVDQIGEGTWVQKWARVLQASKLAGTFRVEASKKKKGWFGGLGRGAAGGEEGGGKGPKGNDDEPVKVRKPVRPTEEELERARKGIDAGAGRAGGGGRFKGEEWMAAGGGGKGMGGGPPPLAS